MGRELKRVPLDFVWPLHKVWDGYLNPHIAGHRRECAMCEGTGLSCEARKLTDKWYGDLPFEPHETGSEPFPADHPLIVSRASRNVGNSETAVSLECSRLARLYNSCWCHHLDSDDIAALFKNDRLSRVDNRAPTQKEVNEWSISSFGHDSINRHIVVKAKAKRLRVPYYCSRCKGSGEVWDNPANKARATRWKPVEPPTGEGWQVWETVSEGSPITPVFPNAGAVIQYLTQVQGYSLSSAKAFIDAKWAPSGVVIGGVFKANIEALA